MTTVIAWEDTRRVDERVTLLTSIVDADCDEFAIDQGVKLVFRASDGGITVQAFVPA